MTGITSTPTTIYILGLGSMGSILASELSKCTTTRIIPLFRNKTKLNLFQKNDCSIKVNKMFLDNKPSIITNYKECYCPETFLKHKSSSFIIDNLIITTKTYQTKNALEPYLPYITSNTNIIMIQNGLGVLDILKNDIFTNEKIRPNIFQGVISHGAYQVTNKDFEFNWAGAVGIKISSLSWNDDFIQSVEEVEIIKHNNSLINSLCTGKFAKEFISEFITYQELLVNQLYKYIINCCINPVTAIVNADNGEIADGASNLFRLIITEALDILKIEYFKLFNEYEDKYNPLNEYPTLDISNQFDIESMVINIINVGCIVNKGNSSSMRQDTLYLRDIEIEFINGYLIKLVEKHKLNKDMVKINLTVVEFAKLRLSLNRCRHENGMNTTKKPTELL